MDERVAKQAAVSLERAKLSPNLVVGEGAEGWLESSPYDRLHVTCGVTSVPYAWVEQTRPGGVIVVPWMAESGAKVKVRLTAVGGGRAVGRIHGGASYMLLRSQRAPLVPIAADARKSASVVDPRRIAHAGPGLRVALAGLLPGASVGRGGSNPVDDTFRLSVRELVEGSHAIAIQPPGDGAAEVSQSGPRNLWDELEAAYLTWAGWGAPGMERFGVAVDAQGQHVWLDSQDNRIIAEVAH